jgi:hypothetical protein
MTGRTKVEIWGGFHKVGTMRVYVDRDSIRKNGAGYELDWGYALMQMSERQRRRIYNHMCGIRGCCCDNYHGWQWEEC